MQYTGLFIWILITYFALGVIVVCGLCAFAGIIGINANCNEDYDSDEEIAGVPTTSTSSTSKSQDETSNLIDPNRRAGGAV